MPTKLRKWVATTTLTDNLLMASFIPLLDAYPDMELVFVTDRVGRPLPRLRYVAPSPTINRYLRLPSRFVLLWKEICAPRVERVVCFLVVPHLLYVVLPAKLLGKPIDMHMFAGPYELEFAHNPAISDNRIVRRLKNPRWLEKFFRWLAVRYVDRFFVPGARTRASLVKLGVPDSKIFTLHSTIDVHKFKPGDCERDIDVLVVARIATIKRPWMTIDILQKVLAQRPQSRFLWLGRGPHEAQIKAYVAGKPIEKALEFAGHIEAIWPFYQRAKVLVLNSLSEGLSTATMEGMASGCVPVSSDVGDMAEVVRTGETGILIHDLDSVDAFADAILQLLNNETERQRLAANGRELIVREHSYESAVRLWRELKATE